MLRLWEGYKGDDLSWEMLKTSCRKFMLPAKFKVTPNNPVLGYLVFAW